MFEKVVFPTLFRSKSSLYPPPGSTNLGGCNCLWVGFGFALAFQQCWDMNSLFYLFSTGAWVSAALVLRSKNPVHSVFYLVLVFMHASGLLCLLGLEFFALLQLLVYVGALAVMFLFVVMLLDIPATEIVAQQRGTLPVAGILLLTLAVVVVLALIQPSADSPMVTPLLPQSGKSMGNSALPSWDSLSIQNPDLVQLGVSLYGVHVDLLLLASLLLLVAMVGAVALTLKRRVGAPLHDVFAQHHRDFQKVVSKITESLKTKGLFFRTTHLKGPPMLFFLFFLEHVREIL